MSTSSSPWLILGAGGFIGTSLSRILRQQDGRVIAPCRTELDLLSRASVANYFSVLHEPFHLVILAGVTRKKNDDLQALQQNINMMDVLFSEIQRKQILDVVYVSSTDVYGVIPVLPITETTAVNPQSYYALSKLCSEFLALRWRDQGISVAILRFPGVYGACDAGRSVVGRFAKLVKSGERVTLANQGKTRRDFVWVDDACRMIGAAAGKNDTFNVVSGKSYSLQEWLHWVAHEVGCEPQIQMGSADARSADLVFDNTMLQQSFPEIVFTPPQQAVCDSIQNMKVSEVK